MADVDTAARERFCNNFCAATEDIAKGLSTGQACASDGNWTKWENFCSRVALNPLHIGYKDPVPILNTFTRDYRTGDIARTSGLVQSHTAEDAVQSIGQALAALRLVETRYRKDRKLDICLRFQLCCYTKQDPPPQPCEASSHSCAPEGGGGGSLHQRCRNAVRMRHDHHRIFLPPASRRVHQGKIGQYPFLHVRHHILLWTIHF